MGKITQKHPNDIRKVKEHRKTIEAGLAKEKTSSNSSRRTRPARATNGSSSRTTPRSLFLVHARQRPLGFPSRHQERGLPPRGPQDSGPAIKYIEDTVSPYLDSGLGLRGQTRGNKGLRRRGAVPPLTQAGIRGSVAGGRLRRDSKYSASFIEVWGKVATVGKTSSTSRPPSRTWTSPRPFARTVMSHLMLVKQLLQRCADRYREQYELYTHKVQDFRPRSFSFRPFGESISSYRSGRRPRRSSAKPRYGPPSSRRTSRKRKKRKEVGIGSCRPRGKHGEIGDIGTESSEALAHADAKDQ